MADSGDAYRCQAIAEAGLALTVRFWDKRMAEVGVRREKVALSSGCKSHPATAPAGSNRSSYGGNEMAEAFGDACHKLVTARVCRP
jgi:hypothetical protein